MCIEMIHRAFIPKTSIEPFVAWLTVFFAGLVLRFQIFMNYTGIMQKRMKTTMIYWDIVGIMLEIYRKSHT